MDGDDDRTTSEGGNSNNSDGVVWALLVGGLVAVGVTLSMGWTIMLVTVAMPWLLYAVVRPDASHRVSRLLWKRWADGRFSRVEAVAAAVGAVVVVVIVVYGIASGDWMWRPAWVAGDGARGPHIQAPWPQTLWGWTRAVLVIVASGAVAHGFNEWRRERLARTVRSGDATPDQIRQLNSVIRQRDETQRRKVEAKAVIEVGGDPSVLGVVHETSETLDGWMKYLIEGNYVKLPESLRNGDLGALPHMVTVGTTGSGKTQAMRRLVQGLLRSGVTVVYLDLKGDPTDAAAFHRIATEARVRPYLWPNMPMDLWRGSETEVTGKVDRLLYGVSDAEGGARYYRSYEQSMLDAAIRGSSTGPPRSIDVLIARLGDPSGNLDRSMERRILNEAADSTEGAKMIAGLIARLRTIQTRLSDLGQIDGGWAIEDLGVCDIEGEYQHGAAYIRIPASSGTAKAIGAAIMYDIIQVVSGDGGRRRMDHPTAPGGAAPMVVIVDEWSAIADNDAVVDPVIEAFERWRSRNARLIIAAQTVDGIGPDSTRIGRILGNAVKAIGFLEDSDDIVRLAGTHKAVEYGWQQGEDGTLTGAAAQRMQEQFTIDPNRLRQLKEGEWFLTRGSEWIFMRWLLPTGQLDMLEQLPMPRARLRAITGGEDLARAIEAEEKIHQAVATAEARKQAQEASDIPFVLSTAAAAKMMGLDGGISEDAVRSAFRQGLKLWHPDGSSYDPVRYARLEEAYKSWQAWLKTRQPEEAVGGSIGVDDDNEGTQWSLWEPQQFDDL